MPASRSLLVQSLIVGTLVVSLLMILPPGLFWLFPLMRLAWYYRLTGALLVCIASLLVVGTLIGAFAAANPVEALFQSLMLVLMATTAIIFIRNLQRGMSLTRAGSLSIVPVVIAISAPLVIGFVRQRERVLQAWNTLVVDPARATLQAYGQAPQLEKELREQYLALDTFLADYHAWGLYLVPAFVGVLLFLFLVSNLWILKWLEPNVFNLEPLNLWRPPDAWFPTQLIGLAAIVLGSFSLGPHWLAAAGANIVLLSAVVYAMAGLSLASYFANQAGRFVWFMFIFGVMLTFPLSFVILVGAGLFDFGLNLRERWTQSNDDSNRS